MVGDGFWIGQDSVSLELCRSVEIFMLSLNSKFKLHTTIEMQVASTYQRSLFFGTN